MVFSWAKCVTESKLAFHLLETQKLPKKGQMGDLGKKRNVTQLMFVEKGVTDHWQNFCSLATPPNSQRLIEHPDDWVLWGGENNMLVITEAELWNQQTC